ncbi:MAG: xanthine dehydrogenase family protein molybdopterin-binding subunit [Chryseolinea sp.]
MESATYCTRRAFLKVSAAASGGFLLSGSLPEFSIAKSFTAPTDKKAILHPFIRIGSDNSIELFISKVEMGQGILTTLAMLVAEELDCAWEKITIQPRGAARGHEINESIYRATTGGSDTTRSEFERYRMAGAMARVMLVQAASQRLGVPLSDCRTENGYVLAGEHRLSYGDLADEASVIQVTNVSLRTEGNWKIIGKSPDRLDTPVKINGKAKYGIDIQFPGLLTAVVARCPYFGGQVKSFDAAKTKALAGVRDVVQIPSGIAVIADHYWAAKLGKDALQIEWTQGDSVLSSETIVSEYVALTKDPGVPVQQKGDVKAALASAPKKIDAVYVFPFLAHAPMEPLNCTVRITGKKCEIWTGTQSPYLHQQEAAAYLEIDINDVEFTTPFLGGSFGRRGSLKDDWVIDAVQIARISGKAIKYVWTREDDITGGYYRPLYVHAVKIGLNSDQVPVAWLHRVIGQSLFAGTALEKDIVIDGIDYSSVDGANGSPYLNEVPNHSLELRTTTLAIPVLPFRSVGNTHTAFVMETIVDEMASMAIKDPVEYRRQLLKNHPRHLAALNLATERAGWTKPLPPNRFRGVAVHGAMGSYVCQIVEISIDNGKLHIHSVVCAIDCGLAVNPDGVKAQMEGGIIYGITAALYGQIDITDSKAKQQNFDSYKMLRFNESPSIEVHIVPSREPMGGAGEPGVPPIAPAIANALFAATGKRIRRLPIKL